MPLQQLLQKLSSIFQRGTLYLDTSFGIRPRYLVAVADTLATRGYASFGFLGLVISSATILDTLPICRLVLQWRQIRKKRQTYHRKPAVDPEKATGSILRSPIQHSSTTTKDPLIDPFLLLSTKLLSLLQWLCVQCIEPRPLSSFAHDALQHVPALAIPIRNLQAYAWTPHVLLIVSVSSSTVALLLLAKRCQGHKRAVVIISYGISNILGLVIWMHIGATSVEYFVALMPLSMSVGASLGLACSAQMSAIVAK